MPKNVTWLQNGNFFRNETKRNETKRNETKRNETKRNETKRNETKRNEKIRKEFFFTKRKISRREILMSTLQLFVRPVDMGTVRPVGQY